MSQQNNEQTASSSNSSANTVPATSSTSTTNTEKPKDDFPTLSLRPGGGFGFGKKPTPAATTTTSTTSSSTDSQPSTKQSRPNSGWKDNYDNKQNKPKDSSSSNFTSPTKESTPEFVPGPPFSSETVLEKKLYDRTFIKKFETLCTETPSDLQESLLEFPELKPDNASMRSSASQFGNFPPRNPQGFQQGFQQQGFNQQGFNQQGFYPGGFQSFNQQGFPQDQTGGYQQRPGKFAKQPYPPQNQQGRGPRPPMQQQQGQPPVKQTELGRRAENPWAPRPSFLKDEKDQILRDIKGILNKITPEKFNKLSTKIQDLFAQVADEQIFAESISLVFAKAVSEPNFSKLYAELCFKLSNVAVKLPNGNIAFRRALLNRCQEEFERASRKVEDLPEDPEERLLAKEKERKSKLGNVKFIGELFKMKLLAEKIIHGCIKILFNAIYKYKDDKETVEMNSELLCKLIATTGKLIDNPEAKNYMDTYFSHISKLAANPEVSARIRFMFQNILELRNNNWIPRREENAPKKISEVHADALQKAYEEEFSLSQPTSGPARVETTKASAPSTTTGTFVDPSKKTKKNKKKGTQPIKTSTSQDDGAVEDQVSSILRDYLSSGDFKDAENSFKELKNYHAKIVECGVIFALEQKEKDQDAVSKLLGTLYSHSVLTQESFLRGFRNVLENLKDIEVDIPFASKLVGKMIGNAVLDKCISHSAFEGLDETVKNSMNDTINKK